VIHRTLCLLVLRKGNNIAQAIAAGHNHDDSIYSQSNAAVRWCAIFKCLKQEAKAVLGLLFLNTQKLKHTCLQLRVMNTYRTTANRKAVMRQIVSTRLDGSRLFIQQVNFIFFGGRKWVV